MVEGCKKKIDRIEVPINEEDLETETQVDFIGDLLLTTALTGRHDILNQIGKVGAATVRFAEEGRWVTIEGKHVLIGANGAILQGGKYLGGKGTKLKKSKKGLSAVEKNTLLAYTQHEYRKINPALRKEAPMDADIKTSVKQIDQALEKIPTFEGTTYRSIVVEKGQLAAIDKKYATGNAITETSYVSTTKSEGKLPSPFQTEGKIIFEIESKSGHEIGKLSQFEHEDEVLFGRNVSFQVLDNKQMSSGIRRIRLREIKRKQFSEIIQFSEWDNAIQMLADAQGLGTEALDPVRRLARSVASDMVGRAKKGVVSELRELTAQAIQEGISVSKFQEWLAHYAENNGYAEAKPYLVENLYRTSSGIGYGIGEKAAYEDPDISDGLWGFRYIATADDRTRPDHWALNNVTLPKDHPFWETHWPGAWAYNCRCSHELIFEDETHRTKRAPQIEEVGFDISLKSTVQRLKDELAAL